MSRHNIYIRKENEDAWQQSSKSDFINDYLENINKLIGKREIVTIKQLEDRYPKKEPTYERTTNWGT